MKAVTIPQPWATLIALGECHFRTFIWDPHYTGTIAIHSAPEPTWAEREKSREALFAQLLQKHNLTYDELPFGKIIATGQLVAVHHSGFQINNLQRQERKLSGSPHWTHRFMFEFGGMLPLDEPIDAPAGPNLWDWDEMDTIVVTEPLEMELGDFDPFTPIAEEPKPKRRKTE